jgi:hypothetical protein
VATPSISKSNSKHETGMFRYGARESHTMRNSVSGLELEGLFHWRAPTAFKRPEPGQKCRSRNISRVYPEKKGAQKSFPLLRSPYLPK